MTCTRCIAIACVALALLGLCLGCAATRLATPSGRPEVFINSTDVAAIRSIILDRFLSNGYTLSSETQSSIIFTKKMDTVGGALYQSLLGNAYSSDPIWEINVTFIPSSSTTRVFASAFTSMQNAFGRVDREDMTSGKPAQQLQELLLSVKSLKEGDSNLSGRIGVIIRNQIVQRVVPGGPADLAGIRAGDKLVAVNGSRLNGDDEHDATLIRGDPRSVALVKLERGSETLEVKVTRGE